MKKANLEGYKTFRSVLKELDREGTPVSLVKLARWCGINNNVSTVVNELGLLKPKQLIDEASKISKG